MLPKRPTLHRLNRVFFSTLTFLTLAAQPGLARKLLPVDSVSSSLGSIDEAIPRMWISGKFAVPKSLSKRLFAGQDLTQVEVDEINRFIQDKSTPNSEKRIIVGRYTMGDPRYTEVLVDAFLNKKIDVIVVTDLNPVLKGDFSSDPSAKFNSDFEKATYQSENSSGAINLKALTEKAKMKFFENIFSQPLYQADDSDDEDARIPILHDKFLIFTRKKPLTELNRGEIRVMFGTNNIAPNPRYNRLLEVVDFELAKVFLAHAENLIETYKNRQETKASPDLNRVKVSYSDGSFIEFAATDGKFNPNERIQNLITEKSASLNEFILSHFVITHRGVVEALREAMTSNPKTKGIVFADDRFSDQNMWGLSPVFIGLEVYSPRGTIRGFPASLVKRINTVVYQKGVAGRIETTQDGPPEARELQHDKTTLLKFTTESVGFVGSFNLSNNSANSELQLEIHGPHKSALLSALKSSVVDFIRDPRNGQWVVPGLEAILRNNVGLIVGVTDLEVPRTLAQGLVKAVAKAEVDRAAGLAEIKSLIAQLLDLPTQLSKKVSREERERRVETIDRFLTWYFNEVLPKVPLRKNPSPSQSGSLEAKTNTSHYWTLVGLGLLVGNPNLLPFKKREIIRDILWYPGITKEEHERLTQYAGKTFFEMSDMMREPSSATNSANSNGVMVFDWDDTIAYMPTSIILFKKDGEPTEGPRELAVSTEEFAKEAKDIGKNGRLKNYEIRVSATDNSFQFFRISGEPDDELSFFRDDITKMISNSSARPWRGPYFEQFIDMLSAKSTASNTYLLTARGHSTKEFRLGLEYLQRYLWQTERKKIHLPPDENLIGIGARPNASANTPHQKGLELIRIATEAKERARNGIVEYADDDKKNIDAALEVLKSSILPTKVVVIVTHVDSDPTKNLSVSCRTVEIEDPPKTLCH